MPGLNSSLFVSGVLIVGFFVLVSAGGLIFFQKVFAPRIPFSEETNNDVIFFASAIGVFYSLVVGLIAVEVWTAYDEARDIISQEAASIAALYRDVSWFPEPLRSELQNDLRTYLTFVIEDVWPAQQRGEILDGGTQMLTAFQDKLYGFEPKSLGQQSIFSEALSEYNQMIELRRLRIDSVGSTLPGVMWAIVVIGAVLAITVTYLLKIEQPTQLLLTVFLALFVGLVIFVIYGMDSPFSGPLSIPPDSYQLVLDRLLNLR
jgi:hypothetical protein